MADAECLSGPRNAHAHAAVAAAAALPGSGSVGHEHWSLDGNRADFLKNPTPRKILAARGQSRRGHYLRNSWNILLVFLFLPKVNIHGEQWSRPPPRITVATAARRYRHTGFSSTGCWAAAGRLLWLLCGVAVRRFRYTELRRPRWIGR